MAEWNNSFAATPIQAETPARHEFFIKTGAATMRQPPFVVVITYQSFKY